MSSSICAIAWIVFVHGAALAQQPAPPAEQLFSEHIRPVLAKSCLPCHNAQTKKSGLDLSTREALLHGGDTGTVVVPGDAKASVLYKRVTHQEQPGMPFGSPKLPDDSIARIADWINAGAPYDAPLAKGPAVPTHWAFKIPQRPPVPRVQNTQWVRNPIDAFVAAEHEKRGLKPLAGADKRTLLRRVYLDVIGLPPTPGEMNAFLADNSKDAYERVVDSLLASPRYGERWGRHWMDIWRYSDWYGWRVQNQVRYSQRNIWHWRDWIIESVNKDKGYDEMIVEMLAGDELAPKNPDVVRATGYLARNWYMFNRNTWLQDTVDYTAMGFLGLTLKCARCHSHKYDPVTHEDYYRFRAFFEPHDVRTDRVPGQPDLLKDGIPRVYDADPTAATYRFLRGNESSPDKDRPLTPAVPAVFGNSELKTAPIPLPLEVYYPDSRAFVHSDLISQSKAEIEKAEAELVKAREELAKIDAKDAPAAEKAKGAITLREKELASARAALPAMQARVAADEAKYAATQPANVEELAAAALKAERHANVLKAEENLLRAQQQLTAARPESETYDKEAAKKLDQARAQIAAAAKALETADAYTPVGKIYSDSSTGRRLALARWIADKQNPLTARVAINHIWLRHFGQALVPTVFNFGMSGKPPSHPELLDWLATEFMNQNWSMKAIHRLIVTSNAYRMQSSTKDPKDRNTSADPENRYLWRMNPRRMEGEAVRDSLLHIAGQLDTAMGGPEIDAKTGLESRRRSVYFQHTPDIQVTFLKIFDEANPNECFQRNESIVPHQALAMANSSLSLKQARLIEQQITKQVGADAATDAKFIARVFDVVLNRFPTAAERAESEKFLAGQNELFRDPAKLTLIKTGAAGEIKPATDPHLRARANLVHVILNHNDFVTIR